MRWAELVYVANIIDYVRILMLYWAYQNTGYTFAAYYGVSYLLDCVDGYAARALKQESKLGYYLDMVIDRISSCLCLHFAAQAVLAGETCVGASMTSAVAMLLWVCIVLVEILAHGSVMYLSEVLGVHQKQMGYDYRIVRMYLGDKALLFAACVSFECFSLSLVVNAPWPLVALSFPGFIFRALANVCRLLAISTLPSTRSQGSAAGSPSACSDSPDGVGTPIAKARARVSSPAPRTASSGAEDSRAAARARAKMVKT